MSENKPIIIDRVDVSGCVHYKNNGKCRIPHYQQSIKYTCCNCNEWDCDFKQLARKTQECDGLKDKIKYMEEYIKTVENARDELERENKFSKEQAEQKLARIREVAKQMNNECFYDDFDCKYCVMLQNILKLLDIQEIE